MLAADFAGEGVKLDVPVHVKDTGYRSYIVILNTHLMSPTAGSTSQGTMETAA